MSFSLYEDPPYLAIFLSHHFEHKDKGNWANTNICIIGKCQAGASVHREHAWGRTSVPEVEYSVINCVLSGAFLNISVPQSVHLQLGVSNTSWGHCEN